jgi:hypothetical protein
LSEAGPAARDSVTLVAILGMHRSGTSAVAGMLAAHGIEFGPVRTRGKFNLRGNRELPALNELHEELLRRSGGSWWDPPPTVAVTAADVRRRDEILATIDGDPAAVKDPRMLLCPDLWSDLELKRIGVVRNPVSVRRSLARRAAERPHKHPQFSARQWEDLWAAYNRELLAEHGRSEFPVIDFDRDDDLEWRVIQALQFWGIEATDESGFFDRELIGQASDTDWREEAESTGALELWDALSPLAAR